MYRSQENQQLSTDLPPVSTRFRRLEKGRFGTDLAQNFPVARKAKHRVLHLASTTPSNAMLANDLKLVTKDIAAEVFSVSVKTIDNYIKDGLLPAPKRFVSKEYWHPDDFRGFLARTFRAHSYINEGGTSVTEALQGETPQVAAALPAVQGTKPARLADSSPVVRQRVRRSALLERLNAPA